MARRPRTDHDAEFARTLAAARGGSREALGRLFESSRSWLLRVAARELHRARRVKTTAADCVQDAFLEAQRDFPHFQGYDRAEFLSWLRRILLHNLADQRRRFSTLTRDVRLERPLGELPDAFPLIANDPSPGEVILAEEQSRQLQSALANLPVYYRTVLRLRHEEGHTFAEIARRMRRPSEDAARKLWERAVRTLRDAFPHDATLAP